MSMSVHAVALTADVDERIRCLTKHQRYNGSRKGRARNARYEATPKAIARKLLYEHTIRAAMRAPGYAGVRFMSIGRPGWCGPQPTIAVTRELFPLIGRTGNEFDIRARYA